MTNASILANAQTFANEEAAALLKSREVPAERTLMTVAQELINCQLAEAKATETLDAARADIKRLRAELATFGRRTRKVKP